MNATAPQSTRGAQEGKPGAAGRVAEIAAWNDAQRLCRLTYRNADADLDRLANQRHRTTLDTNDAGHHADYMAEVMHTYWRRYVTTKDHRWLPLWQQAKTCRVHWESVAERGAA